MFSSIWPGWNSATHPFKSRSLISAASNRSRQQASVVPPEPRRKRCEGNVQGARIRPARRRRVASRRTPSQSPASARNQGVPSLHARLKRYGDRSPMVRRRAEISDDDIGVDFPASSSRLDGATVDRSGNPTSAAYPAMGRMSRSMFIVGVVTAWCPCSLRRSGSSVAPMRKRPLRSHHHSYPSIPHGAGTIAKKTRPTGPSTRPSTGPSTGPSTTGLRILPMPSISVSTTSPALQEPAAGCELRRRRRVCRSTPGRRVETSCND